MAMKLCCAVARLACVLTLVAGVACSKSARTDYKPAEVAVLSKYKIRGKVTYNNQPLTFGYVLFYGQSGVDQQTGKSAPPLVAQIDASGTYEIDGPIVGPNAVCVATDPDVDVSTLYQPASLVPGMMGAPPIGGAPVGGPDGPSGAPGLPPGVGGPPLPPIPPKGDVNTPKSAASEKLTPEQRKVFKGLHEKFGTFGRSPLMFVVAGESDQTYDIELK